jgi:CBS-domain-containing membrane protein
MKSQMKTALTAFAILQIAVLMVIALGVPMILASWASSAALIAGLRASPAARPWAVGVSHVTTAAIGLGVLALIHTGSPIDAAWLVAPAVGIGVFAMLQLKALHPPAAANCLIPILSGPDPIYFAIAAVFGAALLAALAAGMDWLDAKKREAPDAV